MLYETDYYSSSYISLASRSQLIVGAWQMATDQDSSPGGQIIKFFDLPPAKENEEKVEVKGNAKARRPLLPGQNRRTDPQDL